MSRDAVSRRSRSRRDLYIRSSRVGTVIGVTGWRALRPTRAESVLAVVLLCAALTEAVFSDEQPAPTLVRLLAAVVPTIAVAFSRTWPEGAASAVVGVFILQSLEPSPAGTLGAGFAWLAVVFAVAAWSRQPAPWLLALLVAGTMRDLRTTDFEASNVVIDWAFFGFTAGLGHLVRRRTTQAAVLATRLELADAEREAQTLQAVTRERAAIARELHDVVAHAVSLMVVQAGTARPMAQRVDRELAGVLETIENTGREALTELRRLLHVLRTDGRARHGTAPGPEPAEQPRRRHPPNRRRGPHHPRIPTRPPRRNRAVRVPHRPRRADQRGTPRRRVTHRRGGHERPRDPARPGPQPRRHQHDRPARDRNRPDRLARTSAPVRRSHDRRPRRLRVPARSGPAPGRGFAFRGRPAKASHRRTPMIRVLLVDDQHLVREGFARLLRDVPDIEVVGEAADGTSAVAQSLSTLPDLILMDVRMPGMDGVDATAHIVHDRPDARVLILTTFDFDEAVHRALRAGASGFLLKDTPYDQLLHAIRVVAAGDSVLAPSVTRRLIEHFTPQPALTASDAALLDRLTDREREVLHLIAQGLSNAEIGQAIFLSEATVKTHVGRVLTKLGCRDRVQAAIFAHRTGFTTGS